MANRHTAIRGVQIKDHDIGIDQLTENLILVFKGAWSATPGDYAVNDVVEKDGSSYICNATAIATDVPGVSGKWTLLVAKGEKGDKGDKGDTGETGETGAQGNPGETGAQGEPGVDGVNAIATPETLVLDSASDDTYTMFTLAVPDSLMVYMNGLLQEKGSGKDYTASNAGATTVITFEEAVPTGALVIVHSFTVAV